MFAHNPIEAIRNAGDRPVYLVHSYANRRVNASESEKLAAAARDAGVNVQIWFVDRGAHLQTPAVYPEEFERRMVGFYREVLGR